VPSWQAAVAEVCLVFNKARDYPLCDFDKYFTSSLLIVVPAFSGRHPTGLASAETFPCKHSLDGEEQEEKNMKNYMWLGVLAALVVADSLAVTRHVAAQQNGPDVTHAARAQVALANATRGIPFKAAAINSNGVIASCFRCVSATHLALGEYQVIFDENVQAIDTLGTGSISNVSCTTADRAGNVDGVFVLCTLGSSGALTDTSFFLFVAR